MGGRLRESSFGASSRSLDLHPCERLHARDCTTSRTLIGRWKCPLAHAAGRPRGAERVPAAARLPREELHLPRQAVRQEEAGGGRQRGRRGAGGQCRQGDRRRGQERAAEACVRGRAGAGAAEGVLRPLHPPDGLQLALPVHHPGVQHLLHHRQSQAVLRRRAGAACSLFEFLYCLPF